MAYALPFAAGIAIALVNIVITWRLPVKRAADFYNMLMAATAAVYIGSALAAGNRGTLVLESVLAAALFGLALAGQWSSLKFTALAFLAHGSWDLLHVTRGLGANAGADFPVVCVAYDWVIAGYLWWLAPRTNRN
jgi:type IV secretory pathway TrbD component